MAICVIINVTYAPQCTFKHYKALNIFAKTFEIASIWFTSFKRVILIKTLAKVKSRSKSHNWACDMRPLQAFLALHLSPKASHLSSYSSSCLPLLAFPCSVLVLWQVSIGGRSSMLVAKLKEATSPTYLLLLFTTMFRSINLLWGFNFQDTDCFWKSPLPFL